MKTEQFFKEGKNEIGFVGINFNDWFYGMKINPSKKKLYSKVLEKPMTDKEVLSELKPTEITLEDLVNNFKNLPKEGFNIFYIRDKNDLLRAVFVDWHADYGDWDVLVDSVDDPICWNAGDRIFSCNSFDSLTPKTLDGETITIAGQDYKLKVVK